MTRPPTLALLLAATFLGGCVTPPPGGDAGESSYDGGEAPARLVAFGEPFDTSEGRVFVLRIQDEYRVIRCIPTGPIAGCYEDVLSVPGHDVPWNQWLEVSDVPGLRVSFVSPTAIALHQGERPHQAGLPQESGLPHEQTPATELPLAK